MKKTNDKDRRNPDPALLSPFPPNEAGRRANAEPEGNAPQSDDDELVRRLQTDLASLDGVLPIPEPSLSGLEAALAEAKASLRRRERRETAGFFAVAALILAFFFAIVGWAPRLILPVQAAGVTVPLLLLALRSARSAKAKKVKP
ncbi:YxlC family protein [Gorillibacterium sp. sgz500922]|uniref:YxlC family protein n=1 Tax=Gorillibacterium sp. sgz500922 TaxID=3446694 RepID=UPI003F66C6BD